MFRFIIYSILIYIIIFVFLRKTPRVTRHLRKQTGENYDKEEIKELHLSFSTILLISITIAFLITLLQQIM